MDGNDGSLACVRKVVWGMLYMDDARIISTSATRFATMMTVIITIFKAAGHTVSEKKTETMLLRTLEDEISLAPPLAIESTGQRYRQTIYSSISHT